MSERQVIRQATCRLPTRHRVFTAHAYETTVDTKPYLPLLTMLTQAYFGIQSPASLKRSEKEQCEDPIGSGAFTVKEWK